VIGLLSGLVALELLCAAAVDPTSEPCALQLTWGILFLDVFTGLRSVLARSSGLPASVAGLVWMVGAGGQARFRQLGKPLIRQLAQLADQAFVPLLAADVSWAGASGPASVSVALGLSCWP